MKGEHLPITLKIYGFTSLGAFAICFILFIYFLIEYFNNKSAFESYVSKKNKSEEKMKDLEMEKERSKKKMIRFLVLSLIFPFLASMFIDIYNSM